MKIKITTLAENTANVGFVAEWGLSMYVEADGANILFDTGAGTAAPQNARTLELDLTKVDKIVLSHGHYDHTGGLLEILTMIGKPVEVVAHPDIWAAKYGKWGEQLEHYAGIPFKREELEAVGARFTLATEPVKLADNFYTTGEIPMLTDYEKIDTGLFDKKNGELRPDELKDDLASVIDTDFGLVVILGCAHRGVVNTLRQAKKVTGKDLIYAAIGGTHLINASRDRLEKTAADLKEMGLQYLGASHCTGFTASSYLAKEFGDNFFQNNSGSRWTLPFKENTA